jgi:hypothetical protein
LLTKARLDDVCRLFLVAGGLTNVMAYGIN